MKVLMQLTEEQKENFFHIFNNSEIFGLNYLQRDIINKFDGENAEELQELVSHVTSLNAMEIICECESWETYDRHSTAINDLYIAMKGELFDALGITDEDYERWCLL